jgi:D-serine/D-alanine/glycine transporter
MPGGYAAVAMVFAFFAFILWALAQKSDTAVALKVTPIWFVLLGIAYLVIKAKRVDSPQIIRS